MNQELLIKLEKQAEKLTLDIPAPLYDADFTCLFNEQLVKLVVRECARVIDRGDGEMSSTAETIWCNVCRDDILKHFGVEE
jgi:hypothetical protein